MFVLTNVSTIQYTHCVGESTTNGKSGSFWKLRMGALQSPAAIRRWHSSARAPFTECWVAGATSR